MKKRISMAIAVATAAAMMTGAAVPVQLQNGDSEPVRREGC